MKFDRFDRIMAAVMVVLALIFIGSVTTCSYYTVQLIEVISEPENRPTE